MPFQQDDEPMRSFVEALIPPPLRPTLFDDIWHVVEADSAHDELLPMSRVVWDIGAGAAAGVALAERIEQCVDPVSERVLLLAAITAVLGTSYDDAADSTLDHRAIQARVRRVTGVTPAAAMAGSALRVAAAGGFLKRTDASTYVLTAKGASAGQELRSVSSASLRSYANRMEEFIASHDHRAPGGVVRHHVMSALAHLVTEPVRRGALRKDEVAGGFLPTFDGFFDDHVEATLAAVPSLLRRSVDRLVRAACSAEDPVLARLLGHVTAIRHCELAVAGGLSDRPSADISAALGGVWMIVDTSALVAMAETPDRLSEARSCILDAVASGHRVVVLAATIDEYRASLDAASEQLLAAIRCRQENRLPPIAARPRHPWVVRAAVNHGRFYEMVEEASSRGASAHLATVGAFIDELRELPGTLRRLGLGILRAESASPEQERRWLLAVANAKKCQANSPRVVHDANLLHTLEARRRAMPLSFVVSTDATLQAVYRQVVGSGTLGRPPAILSSLVASRLMARLSAPAPTPFRPWRERCVAWSLPAAYLAHHVDISRTVPVDFSRDDLLVADPGTDEQPRVRYERILRLVEDARLSLWTSDVELGNELGQPVVGPEPVVLCTSEIPLRISTWQSTIWPALALKMSAVAVVAVLMRELF